MSKHPLLQKRPCTPHPLLTVEDVHLDDLQEGVPMVNPSPEYELKLTPPFFHTTKPTAVLRNGSTSTWATI